LFKARYNIYVSEEGERGRKGNETVVPKTKMNGVLNEVGK
jgi:hypothetical protein